MITIGEKQFPWAEGMTVADVARRLSITNPSVMLEVNGKVIWHKDWAKTPLADGSIVKVRPIMSGG
jgi:thiamine biosynthesis protein ThiS